MNSKIDQRCYVAPSTIHGKGLFASERIDEGEFIGTFTGKPTQRNGIHVLWLWDEKKDQWTGLKVDNDMRFANHSDDPNAELWDVDMYALRAIEPGEEITFDYQW